MPRTVRSVAAGFALRVLALIGVVLVAGVVVIVAGLLAAWLI